MTGENPEPAARACDECRRTNRKITRVHRGERFCDICYARLFKRRICRKCGNFARLPNFDADAVCLKCEVAGPCVRCGRTKDRTGLRTPYGPACSGCARYFKTLEPCGACGTASRWLSHRRDFDNDLRLCPRCARADHGTCGACRRHRPLTRTDDGGKLCRACATQGEIPCPECGRSMPAGCGKRCEDCYWSQVAASRIDLNAAGVASPAMGRRVRGFGMWLIREIGPHRVALKINRHLEFFQAIDKTWGNVPAYDALVRHFGAAGLRRYPLALRWMEAAGLMVVDPAAREADSERRRIEATLNRTRAVSVEAGETLAGYLAALLSRAADGKCTVRSVRQALAPAAKLLETAAAAGKEPPDQRTLEAFLRRSPGQHAALSGFIAHMRRARGADLTLPRRSALQRQRARRAKLRPELMALMRETGAAGAPDKRWITIALQYFHDLSASAGKNARGEDMKADGDGISVVVKGRSYWIPLPNRASASPAAAGGAAGAAAPAEDDEAAREPDVEPAAP